MLSIPIHWIHWVQIHQILENYDCLLLFKPIYLSRHKTPEKDIIEGFKFEKILAMLFKTQLKTKKTHISEFAKLICKYKCHLLVVFDDLQISGRYIIIYCLNMLRLVFTFILISINVDNGRVYPYPVNIM